MNGWVYILLILLCSCSPIKRHQRLVEKYPFVHTQDTVKIIDSVYVPEIRYDTVTHIKSLLDTIHINHDRLSVKVFRIRDSVYIEGSCSDTIIVRETRVPIRYYESRPSWSGWIKWILIGLFILAVLYIITKFIRNGKN